MGRAARADRDPKADPGGGGHGRRLRGCRLRAALDAGARPPEDLVRNDLEAAARSLCPEIDPALAAVAALDADHVFVSGSGPTVAGLFWDDAGTRASDAAEALGGRYPGAAAAVPVEAGFGAATILS